MKSPGKLNLANIPTPIQNLQFYGKKLLIKRDDLTGVELTGNKIRKLEYLLYNAKRDKCSLVYTTGGEQSNHARATVLAAASLGIKTELFLWGNEKKNANGNLLLNRFCGAKFNYLTKEQFLNVDEIMLKRKAELSVSGEKVFIIREGGSDPAGTWGYIDFIKEIKDANCIKEINGLCIAGGSGGTAAGMLLGNSIHKTAFKIFVVNVLYSKKVLLEKILILIEKTKSLYNLNIKIDLSLLEILDGFSEEGYKKIDSIKMNVIQSFARSTGIILDPVYTGKAFYAYNKIFLVDKKCCKIMFVHTGGIFGVFSRTRDYLGREL